MRYTIVRTLQEVALEAPPTDRTYYGEVRAAKALRDYERCRRRLSPMQAAILLVRRASYSIQAADAAYRHGLPHPVADVWS